MALDLTHVRSLFPALSNPASHPYIYADNAGGSQCAQPVITRIVHYLSHTNVQLGADYSVSQTSTSRVDEGKDAARVLFNAASSDEIVLSSSSTMAVENLARAIESDVEEGEEIVITGEHEANNGPWKKLARRKGLILKYWHVTPVTGANNPYAVAHDIATLIPLITARTRIVAISGCSNILGSVVDIKAAVQAVRKEAAEVGARKVEVSVDCVAYAPHRRMDVRDWDVDYCVCSLYKLYGPHISAMYTRLSALTTSLTSLAHHFLSPSYDNSSSKLMPGGPGYELSYGAIGILEYLLQISPLPSPAAISPSTYTDPNTVEALKATFAAIAKHEQALITPLLGFLTSPKARARGVRVVGEELQSERRVPTISFVVVGEDGSVMTRSRDVVKVFDDKGDIGIRYGHFYAFTLVDHLEPKIDTDDSVVRISLVHYNTVEEVHRIIQVLEEALGL